MSSSFEYKDPPKLSRFLRWAGTIIALGLLIYLIQKQDWGKLAVTIRGLSALVLVGVWLLFFMRILINALRWYAVLRIYQIPIPFWECLKLFHLGLFVSNFLPSTIGGDGIRFLALLRYEERKAVALSSIVIDRLINVIAMFALFPISIVVFFDPIVNYINSRAGLLSSMPGITTILQNWRGSLKRMLEQFLELFQHPWLLAVSFLAAWSAQLLYFYGVWLLARNLGLQIDYLTVLAITVVSYIVTLLPISINGYGLREITITSLYSLLGYPLEIALSIALISRLIYMTTTLPGAIWLPENMSYLGRQ